MEQDLSEEQIERVLYDNVIGHMGCHANETTYVIPICYAYDGIYIYGRTYEGLKLQLLRKNPNVCFQIESIESMIRWKSVICWGIFEELTNNEKRNRAIDVLQNRIVAVVNSKDLLQSQYWPFSTPESKGIIFCIHLHKKTGRYSDSVNY
ncbi:pyridoxamine 5'-phosphate oxidase family protein [Agriterribacter sp.]|uniref:pyridoxamine 5'-phosphate oxidase family protein n=1 Tax=Agriterribacter sp. TaxID=2821509 RepID=UPI002C6251FD|nr:pyridoxamine 5'-phosphate oxidase family protein [Agriterribacter sp.]HRN57237.1 pyridoxamine 5'-phosphate oxidase family protein [Agriterribacter sp.]HRO45718.1 pyridoxamine 5'-phosphate oxidase family protein [Agriterribacter sp.]HRQ15804.1 pyridoxamine 5'-phosphate oxidase family protein [Agriterribacter sp.]